MVRLDSLLWILPATAILLRLTAPSLGTLAYALIALYALRSRAHVIQALAYSWLLTMINPGLSPAGVETEPSALGRYIVLATAAFAVFMRAGSPRFRARVLVRATIWLCLALVLHSLLVSPLKVVSTLKVLFWGTAMCTLLSAWSGLSPDGRSRIVDWLFSRLTVLLLMSLFLLGSPTGVLVNGSGFQGVLVHPQVFGPTIALLGAWIGGAVLARPRAALSLFVMFAVCCWLIVLSESRTGAGALFLGVGLTTVVGPFLGRRRTLDFVPGLRNPRLYGLALLLLVATLASGSALSVSLSEFVSKRGDPETLADALTDSRRGMVETMWENVGEHPVLGIGFGIASDPTDMVVTVDPYFGVAVAASVEKGVLPIAVLEELGIVGFAAVAWWAVVVLRGAVRKGGARGCAVLLTVLFVNLGESMLFSPGGLGLLCLILLAWAASEGRYSTEVRDGIRTS